MAEISGSLKSNSQPRRLRTADAADYLGLAEATLRKARCTGTLDIPYFQLGRTIVYDTADLDEWLANRRRTSTSEPLARPSRPTA